MEFFNDFLTNNYVLVIGAVSILGFIAKLLVGYFAKDKSVIVPASEIIDDVTEFAKKEIMEIRAENYLKNSNIKEGFAVKQPIMAKDGVPNPVIMADGIIKQPSNPNKDEDNSADDEPG